MIKPTIRLPIDSSVDADVQVCPDGTFGWFRIKPAARPLANDVSECKAYKGLVADVALSNQLGDAIYSRAAGGDMVAPLGWTFFGNGLAVVTTNTGPGNSADWIVEVIPNVEELNS